jgi:uncharacterized protein YggE
MNELLQNKKIVASFGLLLLTSSLYLVGQFFLGMKEYSFVGLTPSSPANISVSGEGEAYAKPDVAKISFSVIKEAKTVSEAQNLSAQSINEIMKVLKDSGIEDKDMKTENYNLNPKYEWQSSEKPCIALVGAYCPRDGKQVLVGYEANQSISVKIRKIDDAGKILVAIGDKGATNISGVIFDVEEKDTKTAEAQGEAIKKAQEKAQVLADSLGVKIVRVVSFYENLAPVYSNYSKADLTSLAAAPAAPQLPVGENKFVSNVTITYEVR